MSVLLLSDILPTAWHATEMAEVQKGDRVAIWGAGPGTALFPALDFGSIRGLAARSQRLRGSHVKCSAGMLSVWLMQLWDIGLVQG